MPPSDNLQIYLPTYDNTQLYVTIALVSIILFADCLQGKGVIPLLHWSGNWSPVYISPVDPYTFVPKIVSL